MLRLSVSSVAMIFAVVAIFLLCRELVTWYWKVNKIVVYLASIDEKLGELLERTERPHEPPNEVSVYQTTPNNLGEGDESAVAGRRTRISRREKEMW